MTRPVCPRCQFLVKQCLCDHLSIVHSDIELVVMQHPSEVEHAKNSVRLLPNLLDNVRIVVGETENDFADLKAQLAAKHHPVYLLYPSEQSIEAPQVEHSQQGTLVVLDGTWRKALKMLKLNPWLLSFKSLHFSPQAPSRYRIRKAHRADSLSSLEAAALGLKALQPNMDITPILSAFDAMIEQQLAHMPKHVQARY
ncbi:DTW domain-containing protein [Parashewanella curva]|uniref:tRNA-uridine aminocarboxypropyltransferase n=1 Tax=Parashewanella curva TaxID=2338552 RepID=A0A3L8PZI5_9GAMM|nr:tRNA-uridine aminocarboxypropyltransferase [Parashewanella curva]RLV60725.1 DTW domain-containing protein [Parashewanella curva]